MEDRNKLQDEIEKVKVEVKGMSHKCDNCVKLSGQVDSFSEQNKSFLTELDSVKEKNMFLRNNEYYYQNKIKELEKERSEIKAELIKQLHVIDLRVFIPNTSG